MIALSIHSRFYAVGFLAASTTRLAAAGIGINAIFAYYHDYLFVPSGKAERAMRLLTSLDS